MTREEVLGQIEELLRQSRDGTRGSIDREPNKGDLFCLFAAAFNSGFIDSTGQSDNLDAATLTSTLTNERGTHRPGGMAHLVQSLGRVDIRMATYSATQ